MAYRSPVPAYVFGNPQAYAAAAPALGLGPATGVAQTPYWLGQSVSGAAPASSARAPAPAARAPAPATGATTRGATRGRGFWSGSSGGRRKSRRYRKAKKSKKTRRHI
jgi:hypothetical protein